MKNFTASYIRTLCASLVAMASIFISTTNVYAITHPNILFKAESPYQTVYVTRQKNILSLRNGSRYARSTFMDMTEPYRHVFEYTGLMMMALAYLDEPKNALVIGLGGGTVPKYLKKYYPELNIVNVEMDPVVAKVAEQYFDFVKTSSNRVVVMDGRRFLQRSNKKYDLIFLDAYYGGYIPFHLLTEEFLTLVKGHLSESGVAVSNTWRTQQLYERESATWAAVFGHFDSFLSQRSINRVMIATNTGRHYSPDDLIIRMEATQEKMRFQEINLPDMASATMDLLPSWPAGTPTLTDDYAPVNLLVDPRQKPDK
jgi:spermidine synthase